MYRTIMVPLDGSRLGERALPVAASLARASGARLLLVRAAWEASLLETDPATQIQAIREAEAYLAGVAARLNERGILTETAVPRAPATEGLLQEADLRGADLDLIVMSTHGRSGLGRWVYGSVAEAVLARSTVPVLLVRAAGPNSSLVVEETRPRLLVPLDGSPFAESVLPHAIALARVLRATIVLLQAVTPLAMTAPEMAVLTPVMDQEAFEEEFDHAEAYLAQIVERLNQEGIRATVRVVVGPAADAILDESRALGVSAVIMATHGRTGLGRLVFGSVAAEVLHRGSLPLLLVRPAEVLASVRVPK